MRAFVVPVIGAVVLLFPDRLPAQPPLEAKDGRVTIQLTVNPAATVKPVSRAYLLPEYQDSIPGNRVQMFLRLFMEQDAFFGREESAKREKWNEMPLAELPAEELKDYGGRLLEHGAADAARMTHADWQLWSFLRRDGIYTLLPDVQKMRAIASVLKTRARGQIRAGDADGAIATLRTLFGLARTLDTHPTLIGQLVGIAIGVIACDAAEELVQLPGCPNLFWSFADFPAPFLDLRAGIQGERVLVVTQLKALLEGPVSDAELARLFAQVDEMRQAVAGQEKLAPAQAAARRYAAWAADAERVKTARTRLGETGIKAEVVRAMSPLQVVAADDLQQYAVYRDEMFKWLTLPFWQAEPGSDVRRALAGEKENLVLASALLNGGIKTKQAQARLDQRIAYLRVVEAVRLHAHENAGRLPASLAEIKLPLPVDPVTGKSFTYTVKDGVVTLTGGNPNPGTDTTNRVYEIRLRK